jgi:hypothetical protein
MTPLAEKIIIGLSELKIQEAIALVRKALPANINISSLNGQAKLLENNFQSGLITEGSYVVRLAKLTHALDFFLKQFSEADLRKIETIFTSNGLNANINTMLYFASSPNNVPHLQTENEYAVIKRALTSGSGRDNFKIENPFFATTIDELVGAINNHKPTIIHFSGHAGKRGIVLSDAGNLMEVIPGKILERYFETFDKTINCVFLNACYSAKQAEIISKHVGYVIGMNMPIGDPIATLFSESFYQSLFSESQPDYERAFKQARIKLILKRTKDSSIPEIWKSSAKMPA